MPSNFNSMQSGLEPSVIMLFLQFSVQLDLSCTITRGLGFDSVVPDGITGRYIITLSDSYSLILGGNVIQKFTDGSNPNICWIYSGTTNTVTLYFTTSSNIARTLRAGSQVYLTLFVGGCTTRVIE